VDTFLRQVFNCLDFMNPVTHYFNSQSNLTVMEKVPIFKNWHQITGGEPLRLIDGQHRVNALRRFLSQLGIDPLKRGSGLWWTCDIYNQGK
jgi:hypothetical protein